MNFWLKLLSLPTWERGLKLIFNAANQIGKAVAPYVGAWIETTVYRCCIYLFQVAPYVGAWIETDYSKSYSTTAVLSLPTWERGLKLYWDTISISHECRSLRGSVD